MRHRRSSAVTVPASARAVEHPLQRVGVGGLLAGMAEERRPPLPDCRARHRRRSRRGGARRAPRRTPARGRRGLRDTDPTTRRRIASACGSSPARRWNAPDSISVCRSAGREPHRLAHGDRASPALPCRSYSSASMTSATWSAGFRASRARHAMSGVSAASGERSCSRPAAPLSSSSAPVPLTTTRQTSTSATSIAIAGSAVPARRVPGVRSVAVFRVVGRPSCCALRCSPSGRPVGLTASAADAKAG